MDPNDKLGWEHQILGSIVFSILLNSFSVLREKRVMFQFIWGAAYTIEQQMTLKNKSISDLFDASVLKEVAYHGTVSSMAGLVTTSVIQMSSRG